MCLYLRGLRGHQLIYEIQATFQNLLSRHSWGQVYISKTATRVQCVHSSCFCQNHDPRHPGQLSSILVMSKRTCMLFSFQCNWFNIECLPWRMMWVFLGYRIASYSWTCLNNCFLCRLLISQTRICKVFASKFFCVKTVRRATASN